MKHKLSIILLFIFLPFVVTAQYKVLPNKPFTILNTSPGFISINEATFGVGLSGQTFPYSKHFIGFTFVNGYQINQNFLFAGGVGAYLYESGTLIPLFLDFRFTFNVSKLSPYFFSDGGLLLNIDDPNNTKLFINPGAGARLALSRSLALNLGAGILTQVDGTVRESFVNIKFGLVYKFK
jgi:hypothetical protein